MAKLTFLAGAATGYVLGARAGHNRYEQIRQQWQRFLANPKVQDTRSQLTQQANQLISQGKSRVSSARQQGGSGSSGTSSSEFSGAGSSGTGTGTGFGSPGGTAGSGTSGSGLEGSGLEGSGLAGEGSDSYDVVEIPTTRSDARTDGSTL